MLKKIIASMFLLCGAAAWGADQPDMTLTWYQCVKLAETGNPDIASAREKVIQTESAAGVTRAALLPQISASASASKNRQNTSGSSSTGNEYSYGLTASQLLFDGFKSVYDYKSANAQVRAAQCDYTITSASVRQTLRDAFVNLLKSQDLVKITSEIELRRKHVLDIVTIRYQGGTEHRGSLYTAQADYAQAQADSAAAARDLSAAQRTLATLTGLPQTEKIMATGELTLTEEYSAHPDFDIAAAGNPSVKKTVYARESAEYDAKSSLLAYSPTITGSASAEKTGKSLPGSTTNYTIGIQATASLFEGGKTWYTNAKTDAALRQSEADERSARDTVIRSLDSAWNALQAAIDNVKVQNQYLSAAIERSTIGEAQYTIGTLTFDNWTIIESNLVSTRKSYLEACAEVLRAEAAWIQSNGGALENETQK